METERFLTRRALLKTAAFGTLALPLLETATLLGAEKPAPAPAPTPKSPAPDGRENGLRIGVATYSLRDMSVDDTIATLRVLRIVNAGVFRRHIPWDQTPEAVRAVAEKFHAAGISISGSGVINLSNNEAVLRKAFENAKAAKLATMVCKPDLDALPLVEKFVKEYDQRLAIHNHGPEDEVYPSPKSAFDVIQSLDARIGLCIDVGHAMRAGADPVEDIRRYAARIYDVHLKDSIAVPGAKRDFPVEVGTGNIDIRGILQALLRIKYDGVVAFEYEKAASNPVTGLAESVGYVRGVLAGLAA